MRSLMYRMVCRLPHRWLVCAALLASGCGLSDYEERLEYQQKRLEVLEQEARYLGDPLLFPPKKESGGEKENIDVFVRPPKGIQPKPEEQPYGGYGDNLLLRYPAMGPGTGLQPGQPPPNFLSMYAGWALHQERDTFWRQMLQPFGAYDLAAVKTVDIQPYGRLDPYKYEVLHFTMGGDPPQSYFMYVTHGTVAPGKQVWVGLVYGVPEAKEKDGDVTTAMDLSLKSLGIGEEAQWLRQTYHPAQ